MMHGAYNVKLFMDRGENKGYVIQAEVWFGSSIPGHPRTVFINGDTNMNNSSGRKRIHPWTGLRATCVSRGPNGIRFWRLNVRGRKPTSRKMVQKLPQWKLLISSLYNLQCTTCQLGFWVRPSVIIETGLFYDTCVTNTYKYKFDSYKPCTTLKYNEQGFLASCTKPHVA